MSSKQIDGDIAVGHSAAIGGSATVRGNLKVGHDVTIEGWLNARNIRGAGKGLYATVEKLNAAYPNPQNGWWALVGDTLPAPVYCAWGGQWVATGEKGFSEVTLDLGRMTDLEKALETEVSSRTNADEELTSSLNTETSDREKADEEIKKSLSTETSDRKTADETEKSERESADKVLKSAIEAEYSARKAADEGIMSSLSKETSAREAADDEIKASLSEETTARTAADAELRTLAEGIVGSIDVSEIDNIPASLTDAVAMVKDMKHSRWTLTSEKKVNVGVIDLFSDNMGHQLTEVLTTHYSMNSDGTLDFTSHSDTAIYSYWRSYNISAANVETEVGTWSAWKEYISETVKYSIKSCASRLLDLEQSVWPLQSTLKTTPSLAEYTGSATTVDLEWEVVRQGSPKKPTELRVTMDGTELPIALAANGELPLPVSKLGETLFKLTASADGMTTTSEARTTLVLPIYMGFDETANAEGLAIASLGKCQPQRSAAGTYTRSNAADGKYFWICVPSGMTVGKVTMGGFDVPMEAAAKGSTTLGDYTCYRSSNNLVKGDYTFKVE